MIIKFHIRDIFSVSFSHFVSTASQKIKPFSSLLINTFYKPQKYFSHIFPKVTYFLHVYTTLIVLSRVPLSYDSNNVIYPLNPRFSHILNYIPSIVSDIGLNPEVFITSNPA